MVANIPRIRPADMQLGHRNPQGRRTRRHETLRRRDVRHPRPPHALPAPVQDGTARLGGQGPRQSRRLAHDNAADGHVLVEGLRADAAAPRGCRVADRVFHGDRGLLCLVPFFPLPGQPLLTIDI